MTAPLLPITTSRAAALHVARDAVTNARAALETTAPRAWAGSAASAFEAARAEDLALVDAAAAAIDDAIDAELVYRLARQDLSAALCPTVPVLTSQPTLVGTGSLTTNGWVR